MQNLICSSNIPSDITISFGVEIFEMFMAHIKAAFHLLFREIFSRMKKAK